MKSIRLDPVRAERLRRAARAERITESEFIRRALDRALDERPEQSLYDDLQDVIGIGCLGGGAAERTGQAFAELLADGNRRRRRAPD